MLTNQSTLVIVKLRKREFKNAIYRKNNEKVDKLFYW